MKYTGSSLRNVDYFNVPDTLTILANDSEATFTISPIQDGIPEGVETITISMINPCNGLVYDSLTFPVYDYLPFEILTDDTLVCGRDSARLEVDHPMYSWTWWSTPVSEIVGGDSSTVYGLPDTTTLYFMYGRYKGCQTDTGSLQVKVEPKPIVSIMPQDTTTCLRDSMQLRVNVGPAYWTQYFYNWSPNINLSDKFVKEPLFFAQDNKDYLYVLAVQTPLGCTNRDTTIIRARKPIDLDRVTTDTIIRFGNKIQLEAEGADFYLWSPGATLDNPNSPRPIAYPFEPMYYTVYGISAFGCRDTASVRVDIDFQMTEFIPTAFSPNGDGLNDKFTVFNLRFQKLVEFRMFNRWGEQIFQTDDPSTGWDGSYKGVAQDAGTYFYIIRMSRPDGALKTYKGEVTLIR